MNFPSILMLLVTLAVSHTTGCAQDVPQHTKGVRQGASDSTTVPVAVRPIVPEPDPLNAPPLRLTSRRISLKSGKSFTLRVPEGYDINVAAEGLKRVRFMAMSPDRRLFVTDMNDLTDNRKGRIYILDGFDPESGRFGTISTYLKDLRNPNNIAFRTDSLGQSWLYIALTDSLRRYRYAPGDSIPSSSPELLARFPDYGLSYKYGGWHLTRTVAFGANGKLYVSVGSSCNSCEEKEEVRAAIIEMNPDGSAQRIYASGVRNAVGLRAVRDELFATNMGSDHLGDNKPEDLLYTVKENQNYGWPYCYQYRGKVYADPLHGSSAKRVAPKDVPLAYAAFASHSSPLGLDHFDESSDPALRNSFLVALHGGSKLPLRRGYSIAQVRKGEKPRDFIGGFLSGGKIHGRPADILNVGSNSFFFTDDNAGVVYYVRKR